MFDFDSIEKDIEKEVEIKAAAIRLKAWRHRATAKAGGIAFDAISKEMAEIQMAFSLMEKGTDEFRYTEQVLDDLFIIRGQLDTHMPMTMPTGPIPSHIKQGAQGAGLANNPNASQPILC
ncbi:MAG: hypothetical protein HRU18_02830 [Pseudoalteromonas sp.]|uniref:hypothetical protein n=1 Tax=Pseudoalteromonas sp. TaxID=53249 RepID=UPI001D7C1FD9|nr:hypothetical protein [Pseudoalteromonas sp.]NRA77119.1 hypothetical protein [Pseudoalteromonas sp.]